MLVRGSYEEFKGAKHVVSATLKHNYAYSVYSYGGRQYLTTKVRWHCDARYLHTSAPSQVQRTSLACNGGQNPHQAGFMCTRAQLQTAVSSGCLQRHQQPHWRFPVSRCHDTRTRTQRVPHDIHTPCMLLPGT